MAAIPLYRIADLVKKIVFSFITYIETARLFMVNMLVHRIAPGSKVLYTKARADAQTVLRDFLRDFLLFNFICTK